MNKFIVAIALIASMGAMNAQGVKFGVTAGLNASTVSVSDADGSDIGYKPGFQVGVVADIGITSNFSIIPELSFSQKGFKVSESDDESFELNVGLNYLALPVNAAYKFDLGMSQKIILFAGPYLGYGLSTSVKAKAAGVSVDLDEYDLDVKFGSGEEDIKPIDFGVNIGAGYQFEKIFFKLQYNLGLNNLGQYEEDNISIKNGNVAVSVGYLF